MVPPGGMALTRQPLRFIDRAMLGYLAIVSLIALLRWELKPWAGWVLAANALLATLVLLLARPGPGRTGRLLREIYPILLLPVLYGSLDLLNGFDVRVWDPVVQRWEAALFGGQIARTWWQEAPSRFWSTLLHAAYFAYYLIVPFPVIWFLARRQPDAARYAVSLMAGTFLLCYLAFLVVPVAGPYYEFPRPDGMFVDNWAARLVYATLDHGSSYGAAFPSSHVAATVAAVLGLWLGAPRVALLFVVPTALLTVGVVYCQMHYAVDALAGLVVPFLLLPIIPRPAAASAPAQT